MKIEMSLFRILGTICMQGMNFKESISRIAFILPLRALYYVHTLTLCVVGHVY